MAVSQIPFGHTASLVLSGTKTVSRYDAAPPAVPDCKGTYAEDGLYSGYMSYRRLDGAYFIFSGPDIGNMVISTTKAPVGSDLWEGSLIPGNVDGTYSPIGSYQGFLQVA